jgi:uncharacterized protein YjbI with pentapeptide repeats
MVSELIIYELSLAEIKMIKSGSIAKYNAIVKQIRSNDDDIMIKCTDQCFTDIDLTGINFDFCDLEDTWFRDCNLTDAVFSYSDMMRCEYNNCNLTGANFNGSELMYATFRDCNLTDAVFKKMSCLNHAKFINCDFEYNCFEAPNTDNTIFHDEHIQNTIC